jgi:hypothetical protein
MRLYVVTLHSDTGTTFGRWLIARLSQLLDIVEEQQRTYQLALDEVAQIASYDTIEFPRRNIHVGLSSSELFYVTIVPVDPEGTVVDLL